LLADYRAQLDRARQEATALVEEGRRDGNVVRQRIQEETKREAAEMLERARREIKLATDTAVKEIYDQTAELAVQVAGRIIQKELSAGDHQELVAESLNRMEQTGLN
jgi:F-type H+-transporting ATPase subunit b